MEYELLREDADGNFVRVGEMLNLNLDEAEKVTEERGEAEGVRYALSPYRRVKKAKA